MMNEEDPKIPGIRPLKNLNLLKNITVDRGIGLFVERKTGEQSSDGLTNPSRSD